MEELLGLRRVELGDEADVVRGAADQHLHLRVALERVDGREDAGDPRPAAPQPDVDALTVAAVGTVEVAVVERVDVGSDPRVGHAAGAVDDQGVVVDELVECAPEARR